MQNLLQQQLARVRTAVLALAVLSGGANCASSGEREAEPSATRQGPDAVGSASVAPTWTTEVDTLADAVVVRTGIATDAETELHLIEELRIGEAYEQDERVLGDARFVLPAPDDGVYVWDNSATMLREYDGKGRFRRDVGARGDGPGEYRSANGMVRLKDGRLVLWDPRNLRMSLYDSLGRTVADRRHPSTLGIDNWRGLLVDTADAVYALSWFRSVAVGREAYPGEREGYLVLSAQGEVRDSVMRPPSLGRPAVLVSRMSGGAMIWDYVPFAAQPRWTVSPLGYVVSGVGSRYAITLHRPDGPLRIERELEPVAVAAREKSEAEAAVTADMRTVNREWTWNGPAIPSVKAFFTDLRTSAEGRIWVERVVGAALQDSASAPSGIIAPRGSGAEIIPRRLTAQQERHAFDVYSPHGYLLGTVQVPLRSRITYMRGDRVWGVVIDDMGRTEVVRWRVEPSLAARERAQASAVVIPCTSVGKCDA